MKTIALLPLAAVAVAGWLGLPGAAQAQAALKQKVVTQVAPIGAFYKAEGYHQQYAEKTGHHGCAVPGVVEGI